MGFVNTECFREHGMYFEKYGRYPDGEEGSWEWDDYWEEEHRRVIEGYEVGGKKITGLHYLYLNYLPIRRIVEVKQTVHKNRATNARKVGVKDEKLPDFWDEDYVVFWLWEIAKNGITREELKKLDLGISLVEDDSNLSGGHHFLWLKPRGVGAEQPHSEILITPDGEITMGDVKVGTELYDRTGSVTTVTEVLPQGLKEIWKVKLLDGREVTCGENHLWTVETRIRNGEPEYKTITTEQMFNSGLVYNHSSGQKTYKYKIPALQPVLFPEKELPIPPYVLGALLGDGTISGKNIKIASDDIEIVDKIVSDLNLVWDNAYTYTKDVSNNNHALVLKDKFAFSHLDYENAKFSCNPLKREIENLQLNVTCENKFIPAMYKYGSVYQRLELVKGLMDTDGSVSEQGYCEFTQKSRRLIDDLAYVLRSLGIYCSIGYSKRSGEKTITGKTGRTNTFEDSGYWRLYIATNKSIFNLKRKADRINTKKRTKDSTPIVSIERTGIFEEQSCIIVDNKEHLYLTRDFIVTHNSWKGAVIPARNQFFINNNNTFILADTEQYLLKDGIFEKYVSYMSSLNKTTGFSRLFSKTGNDKMEYRASYWEKNESGVLVEKGKKSSVYGIILDGDANKARGKRGDGLFEEFGSFPKVDKAWEVYQSSVEEDGVVYGTMYGFGTGGDDTSDGIVALTKMFQDPKPYNILELHNKWDEGFYDFPCAYFTPSYRSITFKDAAGNSLEDEGKAYFDAIREDKKKAKDPTVFPNHCAEKPYNPQEALMKLKQNIFPVQDLRKHLNYIRASGMAKAIILKGTLSYGEKGVNFQLNDKLQALVSYPVREEDKTGCWCVVNKPFTVGGVVPANMYRIAVDPYRHDTTTGVSVGACYVVENPNGHTGGMGDRIVAWYVGRPTLQDTFNENIYKAAVYWNAKIGFENDEPGGLIDYGKTHNSPFTGKKLLSYLEEQFELAYDEKMATRSTMKRSFGMHMGSGKTNLRKLQGDKYIQEWLLKPRGMNENGESVYNYQLVYDEGLLEEFCSYGDGNFDRISAFRIAMYHEREFEYKQRKILTVPIVNSFFSRQLYQ